MTHTPGPWHVGIRTAHAKRDVYCPQGSLVSLADAVFTDLDTAQANARLIAAAPDLLASSVAYLENRTTENRAALERAIAKATS